MSSFSNTLKIFNLFLSLSVFLITFISTQNNCSAQIVSNGGFESYNGRLPRSNLYNYRNSDYSRAGYGQPPEAWSWINICLGFCSNSYLLTNPAPDNCGEWYQPTSASSDYYHRWATLKDAQGNYVKDYNGNDIVAYGVTVPNTVIDNRMGIYSVQEPYGYVAGSKVPNAYCGFFTRFMFGGQAPYQEYLQTRLHEPLVANHLYYVSYYVSLAKGPAVTACTQKLGAYFSNEPVLNFTKWDVPNEFDFYMGTLFIGNPNNIVKPQIEDTKLFNQQADANGLGGWMKVEGKIWGGDENGQPYNYMTIGNFEKDGASFRSIDGTYQPYNRIACYYVDSVEITDITSEICLCGPPVYTFNVAPKDGQTDTNLCCYTFSVNVKSDANNKICNLSKFVIKATYVNYTEIVYTNTTGVAKGETVSGEFCISKNNFGGYGEIKITIEYYDTPTHLNCTDEKNVQCKCKCGSNNYQDYRKMIKFRKVTGTCCYDVFLENPFPCHFDGDDLLSILIKPGNNADVTLLSGAWEAKSIPDVKCFRRPDNAYVFPDTKRKIGTICINSHTWPFTVISVGPSDAYPPPPYGGVLCDVDYYLLSCLPWPVTCSDNISVFLNKSFQNDCVFELLYNQKHDESSNCDIYSIKVFNQGGTNPIRIFTSDDPNYPMTSVQDSNYLTMLIPNGYGPGLSYDVGFYDISGNLITMKRVEDSCGSTVPPPSLLNNVNEYYSSDSKTGITNLVVYPNPGRSEFNFNFALTIKQHIKIDVVNELGEKVQNIFDGVLDKNPFYNYRILMDCCGDGGYFIRITGNDFVKNIPFILER